MHSRSRLKIGLIDLGESAIKNLFLIAGIEKGKNGGTCRGLSTLGKFANRYMLTLHGVWSGDAPALIAVQGKNLRTKTVIIIEALQKQCRDQLLRHY